MKQLFYKKWFAIAACKGTAKAAAAGYIPGQAPHTTRAHPSHLLCRMQWPTGTRLAVLLPVLA